MSIGLTWPPIGPRLSAAATALRPAEGGQPGLSFAELLMGPERGPVMPEELYFASSGRDFRGSVEVGETAIRFDARPLVAPAGVARTDHPASLSEGGIPSGLQTIGPALSALSEDIVATARDVSSSAGPVASTESPLAGQYGTTPERAPRPAPGALATPAIAQAPSARAAVPSAGRALPATQAPRAANAVNQARPPASVIVSPGEVLVVVHGLALSAADQRVLLQDVRDLLSAYGLGDRAIRLHPDPEEIPLVATVDAIGALAGSNGASSSTGASQATDAFGLSFENLLKIVLTQLTYQDPLKPMDNFQFVSQLAQFSQIQQSQSMVDSLEALVTAQTTGQAASLLGKEVDVAAGPSLVTGKVTAVSFAAGTPTITIETDDGSTIGSLPLGGVSQIREGN